MRPVKMSWANITPNARKYVNNVLDRRWLSYSLYQPRFEKQVAEMHGAKYGILVNSGTDALRISLATLKELHRWPDGSDVLVPAVTFVATANAVIQNKLRPVFVDVDIATANILPENFKKPAMAVIPVHLFGLPAAIPRTKLRVIEDSCETFGIHKLTGEMACFSFYISHNISTGVGGMILTNSEKYAKVARSYSNHGRIDDGSHFKFGRSGFSSRITEMEAALGMAALEHYGGDLMKRRHLAGHYISGLSDVKQLQVTPYSIRHSWMFYPVKLTFGNRDRLLRYLRKHGIESRESMPLINQPVFRNLYKKGSCPNAENWTTNGLLLPLHPLMTEKDVAYVCRAVKGFFK